MALQKTDLHLHTIDDPMDHHVKHTAEELIDKAARLGYTVLAITLHNRQFESFRIRDYAADRGITLIPGVEQDIEGAHVLLLNFARETADSIRTFADLMRARRPDNLTVAAHPFYPNSVCIKDRLFEQARLFDAVEISGFHHRLWNPNVKAEQAANKLGLPMLGNSDTHTLEQFGSIWTEVECDSRAEGVIEALKKGRGRIQSRTLSALEMGVITYKVVAKGYMPWVNYKRKRGHTVL